MAEIPDLEQALQMLAEIMESEDDLSPDALITDAGVDSLDVLEWMFAMGIDPDQVLDDGSLMEQLETMSIGHLYTALTSRGAAPSHAVSEATG